MPKDTQALTLLTAKSASVHFSQDDACRVLLEKMAMLAAHEARAAQFGVQIGVMLWQTKAALPHGEFQGWIKQHIVGRSYRSCAYYMKLALIFVEKVKPGAQLLETLISVDLGAEKHTASEKIILGELEKFIGENSLTELLIKHGIKGVGLKSELADGEEPPALTGEQQLELDWAQAYEPAKSLADLLAEKAAAFTSEQRAALEAELKRALEAIRAA